MILTTIFLVALLVLIMSVVFSILIGGAGFIIVFGDVAIFVIVLVSIIKAIVKNRKKSKDKKYMYLGFGSFIFRTNNILLYETLLYFKEVSI